LSVTFVRIVNPKVPGGTLVLAWRDFDPAVHTLFVPATAEAARESGTTTTTSDPVIVGDTVRLEQTEPSPVPAKPTRVRKPKPTSTTETV
jgi:hypothetical protein